jgi:Asp-tRNA(Asn)/Glu-tRNA(Gln) amidotransferase B subunit
VLTADRKTADYFEASLLAEVKVNSKQLANWLSGELFSLLNEKMRLRT